MAVEIAAKDVMALRNKTGLSMMECKRALEESGGDPEKAEDLLRKKMKGKMDTRTDRAAGEGRVAVKVADDGRAAVIVEIRAETDFTAKNEKFGVMVDKVATLALGAPAGDVKPTPEMLKPVDEIRISTGENASIARIHKIEGGGDSMFGSYVHHDGKTAVLLHCTGSVSQDTAKQVCMHIAAAMPRPQGVTREDIPAHVIDKERRLAMDMALESGKNEEIAKKIVDGKINALVADLALVEQPFVMDPAKKIKDVLGANGSASAFLRWQVGETA